MARKLYDWEYLKHRYVAGDDTITYESLSALPNAPNVGTIKNRASKENWAEQRKQFRYQITTRVIENVTAQEAIVQTQQLVDAAEVITRHLKLARDIQSVSGRRLQSFDPGELNPTHLISWIKESTNIERLAMGLETSRTAIDVNINYSELSDDQLERLALGEDPRTVLN